MRYSHERHERRQPKSAEPARWPTCAPHLWSVFRAYLERRGLSPALAEENGWYPSTGAGDSWPRVVIPAVRRDGVVYWQARAMDDAAAQQKGAVNFRRYQSPNISRGDALVVVHPFPTVARIPRLCAVVEGPMDALAAAECGVCGVALMGNSPSEEVIDHLRVIIKGFQKAVVVSDLDAVTEAVQVCVAIVPYCRAAVSTAYPHKDLASMPPAQRLTFFDELAEFLR